MLPLHKHRLKEYKAIYKTKYQSGTLTAISYDASGREIGRSEIHSANGTAKIAVEPEKTKAKPGEILYIPVNIVGDNRSVESNADCKVTVHVEGGELLAFGSANPCTEERYDSGSFTTYYGRALAVVQAGNGDSLVITAQGKQNMAQAEIKIEK